MRTLLGLAAALALTAATMGPAAADTTILKKNDKRGDVKIYKTKAISKSKKKSIDIDQASIVQLDNGKFRYKVRIKKIHKSKKWDQMVFFKSYVARDERGRFTYAGFRVRNSIAAYASDSEMGTDCSLKVKRKGRTVWVDVPEKCSPWDGDRVEVTTATGLYQSDEDLHSHDTLRLGTVNYDY
ncbi:hypothetical protein [Aeromicrobium sp. UC242_57]|uniref:hypothetical protein n=1 Tax=Aeromicrobium sp. UC242_57 TaxID=3374624 RepID=UPI0037B91D77